jgi:hypothetical protein
MIFMAGLSLVSRLSYLRKDGRGMPAEVWKGSAAVSAGPAASLKKAADVEGQMSCTPLNNGTQPINTG